MLEQIQQSGRHLPYGQLQSDYLVLLLHYPLLDLLDLASLLAVPDLALAVLLHSPQLSVLEGHQISRLVEFLVDEHLLVELEVLSVHFLPDGP